MTGHLSYELIKCRCDVLILIKHVAKRAKMWKKDCPFPNFNELGRDVALYNVAHDELIKVLRLLTYVYRINGGKTWKPSS